MSVPVTTRLTEETVASLNAAVEAGHAPDRASAIAQAVDDWLRVHDEGRIAESYRQAYDPQHGGIPQTDQELAVIEGALELVERPTWQE